MELAYVEIDRLRLQARHGVLDQELTVGNTFEVSVRLAYDIERAAITDDVSHALDYSRVAASIADEMSRPSALLENVVLRLRERILRDFPMVVSGRIKLAKLTPPMPFNVKEVSISVEF